MTRRTAAPHIGALAAAFAWVVAAPAGAEIAQPLNNKGEKIVYIVTGVQNDESASDELATVFACTNVGNDDVQVTVEIFDDNGNPDGSNTQTLSPGETEAWETNSSAPVTGVKLLSVSSWEDHGSARIIALGKKVLLICVAWVTDADGTAVDTTMYMNLPVVPQLKEPKLKPRKN